MKKLLGSLLFSLVLSPIMKAETVTFTPEEVEKQKAAREKQAAKARADVPVNVVEAGEAKEAKGETVVKDPATGADRRAARQTGRQESRAARREARGEHREARREARQEHRAARQEGRKARKEARGTVTTVDTTKTKTQTPKAGRTTGTKQTWNY